MSSLRQGISGQVIPLYRRCSACNGAGKVEQLGKSGPIGSIPCGVCYGSGQKITALVRREVAIATGQ